jgi:hypothetical protein
MQRGLLTTAVCMSGPRRALLAGCASIGALGAVTFSVLRATNFRGYDEWLIFWMLSRRLLSFPHANRPLGLVWHAPAWWIAPDRLWGFVLVHGFWLTLVGLLTFLLVRRLSGGDARLALLSGAFTVAWMPSETTRVVTVQMIQYSGCAAGTLLATWLQVEAWQRQSRWRLAAAAVAAAAAALSLEAALPQLAAAPLLLLFAGAEGRRQAVRRLWWLAGSLAFVGALGARALLPVLTEPQAVSYQLGRGSVRPPGAVLRQIGLQLRFHLAPLVDTPAGDLAGPTVACAALVFVLGLAVAARHGPAGVRRVAAAAAVLGLAHAVLGYLPFVLSRAVRGPVRTEFLAAAGVGVFLAALVSLLASLTPPRARVAVSAVLGVWIVAAGTGRTVASQREWSDAIYAAQRRTLEQVAAIAPEMQPHTLVVLMQNGHTWSFSFSFSKAVEYLYADAVRGWVPRADPYLIDTRVQRGAVVSEPAAVLRAQWKERTETYRAEEVVVVTEDEAGRLSLAEEWPEDLGPLPAGGRYAPRARIRNAASPPSRLALLRETR